MVFDEIGPDGTTVVVPDGVMYRLTVTIDRPRHRQIRIEDNGEHAGNATRELDGWYHVNVGNLTHRIIYLGHEVEAGVAALHRYLYGAEGLTMP